MNKPGYVEYTDYAKIYKGVYVDGLRFITTEEAQAENIQGIVKGAPDAESILK